MGIFTSYTETTFLQPTDTFVIQRIAGSGAQTYSIQAQYMNFGNAVVSNTYDVAMGFTGTIPESETILVFNIATAFSLPSGLTGSQFTVQTAPDADITLVINKNNAEIGTIVFANASTTGTATFTSAVTFTAGDELKVITSNTTANSQTLALTFKGAKT